MSILRRRARRPPLWPWRPERPWRRFRIGLGLLVGVLAFGTSGYVVVGLTPFDALYQTAITISTVGYGEVGRADEIDRAYRVFTLILVLAGASTIVYTASVLLETLVEGTIHDGFRRSRVQRRVDRMTGHVIVAGFGRVGRAIADYARGHGMDVAAIERDPGQPTDDVPVVVGDATDDDVLVAAGIERANSLIAALGSDNDNLSLTLAARSLRSDLRIVARVADDRSRRKFTRAGANQVVNPYDIGGSRMAAIAFRPHVAEFLDEVIHAAEYDIDIHELAVTAGSPGDGVLLRELTDPATTVAVIAIKSADGDYVFNPAATQKITAGDILIVVGSAGALEQLGRNVSSTVL